MRNLFLMLAIASAPLGPVLAQDGSMVFVEPMVTRDFLESRADVTTPVPVAERYQRPGYYPTQYRVGFDAAADAHVVVLEGLVRHGQIAGR